MAKKSDEVSEKGKVDAEVQKTDTLQTQNSDTTKTEVSLAEIVESQRKFAIVFAVLIGVAFLWLAYISARMYANEHQVMQSNFMNEHQMWHNSNGSSGDTGFGNWPFR